MPLTGPSINVIFLLQLVCLNLLQPAKYREAHVKSLSSVLFLRDVENFGCGIMSYQLVIFWFENAATLGFVSEGTITGSPLLSRSLTI